MCFHYSLVAEIQAITSRFRVSNDGIENYTPQTHINGFSNVQSPVVIKQDNMHAVMANWGLIPEWVRTTEQAEKMRKITLNARVETVFEKPSFKTSVRHHRCLIPATGFFEWKLVGKKKYPHLIYVKDQDIFAFAGIYSEWGTNMGNESFHTFTILTKAANPLMADIHNTQKRMPVILSEENEAQWINPKINHREISDIIKRENNDKLDFRTISSDFMHTQNPDPSVLKVYHYPELDNNLLF